MNDSNRIVYNTIISYGQLLLNTIIGLFVTRFVLKALGEEDYGIYMLVGGVVAMLNMLSSSMSNTSMRFMSFSLGEGDVQKSCRIFNNTLLIHIILGLIIIVVLEVGGWLIFDYVLNIPDYRLYSAKVVFQFMVFTTFFAIIAVPYDAVINAHENLLFLAIVSTIETILKLLLSIYLLTSAKDRLIEYGAALMIIQLLSRFIKQIYSSKKYQECKVDFRKNNDSNLRKTILSFTGWEFFASIALVSSNQLKGIVMNYFYGVRLNTPEGIAQRVNGQVNMVSVGITKAITPQLMKSEGVGNRERMILLTMTGVKFTTFMFALVAIPIAIEAPYLLKVWLGNVPEYTVFFCQLCFIQQLIDKFTWQIGNAIRAIGNIKRYQIVTGSMTLLTIVLGFIAYALGASPESIFYVEIFVTMLIGVSRLLYGKRIAGINPTIFIKQTTLPVILPFVLPLIACLFVYFYMPIGFVRMFIVFSIFILTYSLLFYLWGVTKEEKRLLIQLFGKIINKINKHE